MAVVILRIPHGLNRAATNTANCNSVNDEEHLMQSSCDLAENNTLMHADSDLSMSSQQIPRVQSVPAIGTQQVGGIDISHLSTQIPLRESIIHSSSARDQLKNKKKNAADRMLQQ